MREPEGPGADLSGGELRFVSPKGCSALAQGCRGATTLGRIAPFNVSTLKGLHRGGAGTSETPLGFTGPLGPRTPGWPLRGDPGLQYGTASRLGAASLTPAAGRA